MPAKAPTWMIRSSNSERPGDRAKHRFGQLLGAAQLVGAKRQRDREFVAAEARDHRLGAEALVERRRRCSCSSRSPVS